MKDAVIFHPTRTIGESAEAAVGMEQNELVAEYTESAHPYKQPAEVLHIADETRKQTGYVLFPKVTKFNTWLLCRYGKRLETELTEGIMAGEYAATMGLNGAAIAHVSCRFSPRMSLWRVNRYEFIADVPVEISWESSAGDETAEGYVSLNCCLDENFCYFIDSVSLEKPDRPLIRLDEYLHQVTYRHFRFLLDFKDFSAASRDAPGAFRSRATGPSSGGVVFQSRLRMSRSGSRQRVPPRS